jgi:hypothetical protein
LIYFVNITHLFLQVYNFILLKKLNFIEQHIREMNIYDHILDNAHVVFPLYDTIKQKMRKPGLCLFSKTV